MSNCVSCAYFEPSDGKRVDTAAAQREGYCLCNPPVLFAVPIPPSPAFPQGNVGFQSLRPVTRGNLRCREYRLA